MWKCAYFNMHIWFWYKNAKKCAYFWKYAHFFSKKKMCILKYAHFFSQKITKKCAYFNMHILFFFKICTFFFENMHIWQKKSQIQQNMHIFFAKKWRKKMCILKYAHFLAKYDADKKCAYFSGFGFFVKYAHFRTLIKT
jgi:hypothetical protein